MIKYMGSKNKHALEIIDAIRKDNKWNLSGFKYWVEPFVGGANMIETVGGLCLTRIGNDKNEFLIAMFKALQKGWVPPMSVSEQEYNTEKLLYNTYSECGHSSYFDDLNVMARIGFVGIACSWGAKWWDGYARGRTNKGVSRNYTRESWDNLDKNRHKILGVDFRSGDYNNLMIPDKSVVYCDPPYNDTTKYGNKGFDYAEFWEWAIKQKEHGNAVYVSEYSAPEYAKCIWQKPVKISFKKGAIRTEKLFKV